MTADLIQEYRLAQKQAEELAEDLKYATRTYARVHNMRYSLLSPIMNGTPDPLQTLLGMLESVTKKNFHKPSKTGCNVILRDKDAVITISLDSCDGKAERAIELMIMSLGEVPYSRKVSEHGIKFVMRDFTDYFQKRIHPIVSAAVNEKSHRFEEFLEYLRELDKKQFIAHREIGPFSRQVAEDSQRLHERLQDMPERIRFHSTPSFWDR